MVGAREEEEGEPVQHGKYYVYYSSARRWKARPRGGRK